MAFKIAGISMHQMSRVRMIGQKICDNLKPAQMPAMPPMVERMTDDIDMTLSPQTAGRYAPTDEPTKSPIQMKDFEFMEI